MKKIGELNGIEIFEDPDADGVYFVDASRLTKEQKRELEEGIRIKVSTEFWRGVTVSMGPG